MTHYLHRNSNINYCGILIGNNEVRALNDIFKVLKENCQTRILYLKKIFNSEDQNENFSGK